jgi:hypothetical protein
MTSSVKRIDENSGREFQRPPKARDFGRLILVLVLDECAANANRFVSASSCSPRDSNNSIVVNTPGDPRGTTYLRQSEYYLSKFVRVKQPAAFFCATYFDVLRSMSKRVKHQSRAFVLRCPENLSI